MKGPDLDQRSGAKTLFEYKWIITKEIDRINRQSQRWTSLSARIEKLKGLAEPLLWHEDEELSRRLGTRIERLLEREGYNASVTRFAPVLVIDQDAVGWCKAWDRISAGEGYNPRSLHDVRWRQFAHLMRLFKARGAFIEGQVPTARISAFEAFESLGGN